MKSVQIRSFFWSVFIPSMRKYWPEKIPYLGTFHAVIEEGLTNGFDPSNVKFYSIAVSKENQMPVSFLNSICWLNDFYLKLKFPFVSKNLEIRETRFYREKRRKSNSKRVGWFWCEIRCKVSSGKLIFALYDNLLISSFFLRLNIE